MKLTESYINNLYIGEIRPLDDLMPNTDEYKELSKTIDESITKLKQSTDDNTNNMIVDLTEQLNAQSTEYGAICFKEGIKHGILLMTEVFAEKKVDSDEDIR